MFTSTIMNPLSWVWLARSIDRSHLVVERNVLWNVSLHGNVHMSMFHVCIAPSASCLVWANVFPCSMIVSHSQQSVRCEQLFFILVIGHLKVSMSITVLGQASVCLGLGRRWRGTAPHSTGSSVDTSSNKSQHRLQVWPALSREENLCVWNPVCVESTYKRCAKLTTICFVSS